MNFIDQHMHTEFSFDSEEKFENYLERTDSIIVSTEHYDIADPESSMVDLWFDYDKYSEKVKALNEVYNNRVYRGVEIGWIASQHDRIVEFLEEREFDLVLLSIHQNGHYGFMDRKAVKGFNHEALIKEYLSLILDGINEMHDHFDILAHFDYGFRVHEITADDLEHYGKDLFIKICDALIKYDLGFELNTSSMYKHKKKDLYNWGVDIYLERGGKNLTLGSDAHSANDYQREFEDVFKFLKEKNVDSIQCYLKGHEGRINIPN